MMYSVQFLRHAAASIVVFHHAAVYFSPKFEIDRAAVLYVSEVGASGVHIFFMISGFVMVWSQANQFGSANGWKFFKRRAARIYPLYWFLAAANLPVTMMLGYSTPQSAAEWFGAIILWPSQAAAMIEVGWTLGYEMFFYLVFAALLVLQWNMRNTLYLLSILFVGLIIIGQIISPSPSGAAFVFTNALLAEFVIGAWIARIILAKPKPPLWLGWIGAVGGIAGLAVSPLIGYDTLPRVIIWGVPSTLLVFGFLVIERHAYFVTIFKRFANLGDASYALYLCHVTLLLLAATLLPDTLGLGMVGFIFLSAVYYGLCVVVAVVINRFIEKPILARIMPKRRARKAAPQHPLSN